jgi:hypothetical protein
MKICPICQQKYTDENLNFCLNDGGILSFANDDPTPTVIMDSPRRTNPNWDNYQQPTYQNQQMTTPQNYGMQGQNPNFVQGQNQTLPTISLITGIIGFLTICCWGAVPFGIVAIITGYLGYTNSNSNPNQYGGKGLAIAGMILGAVELMIMVLIVLFSLIT